jgi:protein ImuB
MERFAVGPLACVNLAAFPLQLLLRRHRAWRLSPVAVVAEERPTARILWVNEKAREKGVLPGLRYAAGASLAPGLRAGAVRPKEIQAAIESLAGKLARFSPRIEPSREEPGVFWLDATGLGLLFPSLPRWASRVRRAVEEEGFAASVVAGYTRFGTYAVARSRGGVLVFRSPAQERAAAARVALDCLQLEPQLREALRKLGVKTVGAFLELPAAGLLERFGPEAYRLHRLAADELWRPLEPRTAEEPVLQRMVFDHPETDRARLLFLVKRLLHPLLTALASRGEAVAELWMGLLLEGAGWQRERIRPAAPTLDPVQLLDLVRLRLEMIELAAGIVEAELAVSAARAFPEQLRLFAERPGRDLDAADRALARLRAELGEEAVARAKLADGHLPEARFAWEPTSGVALPRNVSNGLSRSSDSNDSNRPAKILVRRILSRPLPLPSPPKTHDDGWLVLGPKHGPVERLSGPYVISGGWWNREIHRDYYFAETRRGDLLWVYYDRIRRRWFLQGRVE